MRFGLCGFVSLLIEAGGQVIPYVLLVALKAGIAILVHRVCMRST